MKRRMRNVSIILICSVITGSLMLVLTFLLPVQPARNHVLDSMYEMMEVMEDPEGSTVRKAIIGFKENFTDSLMVQNALEKVEGHGPLEHAMNIYHYDLGNETTWRTEESLKEFLYEGTENMYLREYSKYWHGYLVILKPLLICMSWKHMESLMVFLQAALLLAAVILAFLKKKGGLGLGIICTFLFMKPLRIWFSLAMSVCWTIALGAVIVLFLYFKQLKTKKWIEEFFLIVGILTAYMDFLTYPVVTLAVPLCTWLALDMEKSAAFVQKLKQAFWNCACWVIGYIGMWGMKWVTAEVTCRTGTLRNAAWSVITRTSPLDGYNSFFSGVSRTFSAVLKQYDSPLYGIAFLLIALAALLSSIFCLIKARGKGWGVTVLCLVLAALFPVGWLILTQNHTAIHCIFTFRIMGASIMALWCITLCSIASLKREKGTKSSEGTDLL